MAEHGFEGMTSLAVLLIAVVLGVLGALRWDALMLWFKSSFLSPPIEPSLMQIVRMHHQPQAPRGLLHAELQHQALHRRPDFHRSGRRG